MTDFTYLTGKDLAGHAEVAMTPLNLSEAEIDLTPQSRQWLLTQESVDDDLIETLERIANAKKRDILFSATIDRDNPTVLSIPSTSVSGRPNQHVLEILPETKTIEVLFGETAAFKFKGQELAEIQFTTRHRAYNIKFSEPGIVVEDIVRMTIKEPLKTVVKYDASGNAIGRAPQPQADMERLNNHFRNSDFIRRIRRHEINPAISLNELVRSILVEDFGFQLAVEAE